MSNYTEAVQTRMLATNCVACGRPLVDAVSIEVGMGPCCRADIYPANVDNGDRQVANQLVYQAAIAAQSGQAEKVIQIAEAIRGLGFVELADKVANRFKAGVEEIARRADITIEERGGFLFIHTPYRRKDSQDFIEAWRGVPGRRFDRNLRANVVPPDSRAQVWSLLCKFFPGKWGKGPKGAFRVPKVAVAK